jgi:hypothetical protein
VNTFAQRERRHRRRENASPLEGLKPLRLWKLRSARNAALRTKKSSRSRSL